MNKAYFINHAKNSGKRCRYCWVGAWSQTLTSKI